MRHITRMLLAASLVGALGFAGTSFAAPAEQNDGFDCNDPTNASVSVCKGVAPRHAPLSGGSGTASVSGDDPAAEADADTTAATNSSEAARTNPQEPRDNSTAQGARPSARSQDRYRRPDPQDDDGNPLLDGRNGRPPTEDRGFRGLFDGFGFGARPQQSFDVDVGARVPYSFPLRPVPFRIYRDYPEYEGFLSLTTRDGSIAIVNPRSRRIVDIL